MLNLSHNTLSGVVTITELPALRALIVNDNQIESVQGETALPGAAGLHPLRRSQLAAPLESTEHGASKAAQLSACIQEEYMQVAWHISPCQNKRHSVASADPDKSPMQPLFG